MRKSYVLIIVLASLLLTGCLGGSGVKQIYDGSPTPVNIVLKRETVNPASIVPLAVADEDEFVNVRIWKTNENGDVVYSVIREVPLGDLQSGYTLSETMPSDKGYNVAAIYADRQGKFEVGGNKINAPANTLTTTTVSLAPLDYTLVVPSQMYKGGSLNQFKVILPDEYKDVFDVGLYYWGTPWSSNGGDYPYSIGYTHLRTPAYIDVYEPWPLYYQFVISLKSDYSKRPWVDRTYIPNLDYGTELPFIMTYPSPGSNQ